METALELYEAVKVRFSETTTQADSEHIKHWGDLDPQFAYSWFESLAKVINSEMERAIDYSVHEPMFEFFASTLPGCSKVIYECIDVALVENLFYNVSGTKAQPYWRRLPKSLQELYVAFHQRTPA